jgi:hypothetical protein
VTKKKRSANTRRRRRDTGPIIRPPHNPPSRRVSEKRNSALPASALCRPLRGFLPPGSASLFGKSQTRPKRESAPAGGIVISITEFFGRRTWGDPVNAGLHKVLCDRRLVGSVVVEHFEYCPNKDIV